MPRRGVRRISRGRARASVSRKGGSLSFGNVKLRVSTGFLAGVALGLTNLDNKIPADVRIALAAAPVTGIGMVKGFAQGTILGDIAQKRLGFRLPAGAMSGRQPAFVGV